MWDDRYCSVVERHEGGVIWENACGNLEKVDESLPLSRETVDDVFVMVSDWCLEEEGEVREDGAQFLTINLHTGEELSKDDHIVQEGSGEQ